MIKEALLSLLAKGPSYGYQLKIEFEEATGNAWPLNVGQVYTTLSRMERDGLVTSIGEDEEGRPSYEITHKGNEELLGWLTDSVERTISTRDELSMKILMATATDVVNPEKTIAAQRRSSMQSLQDATERRRKSNSQADILHIERLIANLKAELTWLDIAEERINETTKGKGK